MTVPLTILQQETIADAAADWAQSVPFNQFNPASGDLLDAAFTTAGTIDAAASIENLAPVAASVDLNVAATIVATAPDIGVVGLLTPFVAAAVTLAPLPGAFDGVLDFGGPSGTVLPDLTNSQSQTAVVQTGSVGTLPFVGTGTFDVGVSSYATSTVDGNGNLAVLLHSSVGAVVSLQYDATGPAGGGDNYADSVDTGLNASGLLEIFVNNLETTAPQVVTLPSQTSGWTGTASFARFSPALGTLVAINLNVGNTLAGTFSAANLEAVAAGVSMTETASMVATTPGFATGVTAIATAADKISLGSYDGTADFTGPSGQSDTIDGPARLYDTGSANQPGTETVWDPTDLAAFTGTGSIALLVSTAGTSVVTGPSNLLTELTQHTGGTISVSYVYATPAVTADAVPSGPMLGAAHLSPIGTVVPWALAPAGMTFIGAFQTGVTVDAKPNQTFLIGSGATATIGDFAPASGDRLDLTSVLAGAPLASDLSNLGAFVRITAGGPDGNGGTDTTLAITAPGGTASLTLVTSTPIAVADLLNDNALVLPAH